MECYHWKSRNLFLIKYVGGLVIKEVLENELSLVREMNRLSNPLVFVDVKDASLSNLKASDLRKIINLYDNNLSDSTKLRMAVYSPNEFDDALKVKKMLEEMRDRSFTIILFNVLDSAIKWLDLSGDQVQFIKSKLW